MPFDFEDFPVYKDAIKFIQEVDALRMCCLFSDICSEEIN